MKYLKKVILKNFQSHKDSSIEFDQGLNIIVGPSDSGKSAVIRGIKWALYNDPAGDYFIREGEKEASVTLEFSNNIKIKRLRSKSKNSYIIINNDGEEIIFEGFGNKVPQEIIDLIGIEKVPLDTNESNAINLGEQLEGAFLLSEKGSTRASAIGRLVGVNLIDDALKDTLKDVRNISIEKKSLTESIKSTEEELITFNYLDNLKENILKMEDIRDNIRKKTIMKDKLIIALDLYKKIYSDKKHINNIIDNLGNPDLLEKYIYILESKNKDLNLYKKLNNGINRNKHELVYNKAIINKLISNKTIEKSAKIIEEVIIKLKILEKNNTKIKYYKKEIRETAIEIQGLKHIDLIKDKVNITQLKIEKLGKLNIINSNIKSIYKSINIGEQYLEKLHNLDQIDLLFNAITNLTNRLDQVILSSKNLKRVKLEIDEQDKILQNSKNTMDNNLEKYELLLNQYETCPFCLSVINENKIEHIIKHYS